MVSCMPGQKYDYEPAKVLHAKGLTIREIANQTKIPEEAIQAYSRRHKWRQERAKAMQLVSDGVQAQLAAMAGKHLIDVSGIVSKSIDALALKDLKSMPLDDVHTFATSVEVLDRIARRTYALDNQEGKITLNMAVQVSPPSTTKPLGAIIDVEPENGAGQAQLTDGK
jgi:hypothetical protein